jgi:hypothetical protein
MTDVIIRSQFVLDMDMAGVTPTPAFVYSGPGDAVPGALGWWGIRAYSNAIATAITNVINLRRDSDNATKDFTVLANGDLDVASISSWQVAAGAANLWVTALYDQSGSGTTLSQNTAANQLSFTLGGTAKTSYMVFPNNTYVFGGSYTVSLPYSLVGDVTTAGTSGANPILGFSNFGGTGDVIGYYNPFGSGIMQDSAGANIFAGGAGALVGVFTGTSAAFLNANGTVATGTVGVAVASWSMIFGGKIVGVGDGQNNHAHEGGVWASALTSGTSGTAQALVTNARNYWGY